MGISRLEIEGFMSLKHVSWEPGSLNVVIGPNGSGKSNLLRFLQFTAAAAEGRLCKFVQSMGGVGALLWDGKAERLSFRLTGRQDAEGPNEYFLELSPGDSSRLSYYTSSERLVLAGKPVLDRTPRESSSLVKEAETQKFFAQMFGGVPYDETLLSARRGPLEAEVPGSSYRAKLASVAVYHGLNVDPEAPIRQSQVARYEQRVDEDGTNLVAVLHTLYTGSRDFKRQVDLAMSAAFGVEYEELQFAPAADQRVQMRVSWRSLKRPQSAAGLSDGTLRYLFLLAILADPAPPWLIAIDEPETGLHPSMLRMVAEYAVDASRRTQLILTTHSPQFLDAFGDARPDVTVAQFLDGETHLRRVEGETLSHWLSRYSLGELFKLGELEDLQ